MCRQTDNRIIITYLSPIIIPARTDNNYALTVYHTVTQGTRLLWETKLYSSIYSHIIQWRRNSIVVVKFRKCHM